MPDEGVYLFSTGFGLDDVVHFVEGLDEGLDVVFGLEGLVEIEFD